MVIKLISEMTSEISFDVSEEKALQLIGAATTYAAENAAKKSAAYGAAEDGVKQPEQKLEKPVSRVERMFGDYHKRIPIDTVIPPMPAVHKPKPADCYKGFLLIECADCGKVRGFYAKNPQTVYYCDCGCQTPLESLRPMYPKCAKCGSTFKYLTNIGDPELTYNCLTCGSPIDMELNTRRDTFVNVDSRF
jgi:hypothetical protein